MVQRPPNRVTLQIQKNQKVLGTDVLLGKECAPIMLTFPSDALDLPRSINAILRS